MKKSKSKKIESKNTKRTPDRAKHFSWGIDDVVEIKPTKRTAKRK
jgi:hypothetical protein